MGVPVACFKVTGQQWSRRIEEDHEETQNNQSSGQEPNLRPPRYEAGVQTIQTHLVHNIFKFYNTSSLL
jgi:hypothetical protein